MHQPEPNDFEILVALTQARHSARQLTRWFFNLARNHPELFRCLNGPFILPYLDTLSTNCETQAETYRQKLATEP